MTEHLPMSVTSAAAAVPFAAAVLVTAVGVVRSATSGRQAGAELAAALGLALELFLAAGLLRLAAGPDLKMLAVVGSIIAVRRISVIGVKAAARAFGAMPGMRLRA